MESKNTYGQELDLQDMEYVQTLNPIFDTVLDTYSNVTDAPHVTGNITLFEALQKIKYNLGQDVSPEMFLNEKYLDGRLNQEYVKEKEKMPAVCYNAAFKRYKNLKNTKEIHNLMFLDIDNFSSKQEALDYKTEIINKYKWILACSLSLSKIGLHIIAKVDRIVDSKDFNRKYDYISQTYFNGRLDPDSKSLSRYTILPYDYGIYINEYPEELPIDDLFTEGTRSTYINDKTSTLVKGMGSAYIKTGSTSSNTLSESNTKSTSSIYTQFKEDDDGLQMGSTSSAYIKGHDELEGDSKESMSSAYKEREGICTTYTHSSLQTLNEVLNVAARENGLIFRPLINEDLIADPNKPYFVPEGIQVIEINLFPYYRNGVPEGKRTSFLGAIISQMLYLNVMLPENPDKDVRVSVLKFIKWVNKNFCLPPLPNVELLKSYNYHWKRCREGSLDVSQYLKPKRFFWSQFTTLTANEKRSVSMSMHHAKRKETNLVLMYAILSDMAYHGEVITQKAVVEVFKKLDYKGLGLTTIKKLWHHFQPSIDEYKKGITNTIRIAELLSKYLSKDKYTSCLPKLVAEDSMSLADINMSLSENPETIKLKKQESEFQNSWKANEKQLEDLYQSVYERILPKLDSYQQVELHKAFIGKFKTLNISEQQLVLTEYNDISNDRDFWRKGTFLQQFLDLCASFINPE